MKVLLIIALMGLFYLSIQSLWLIGGILLLVAVWWLIRTDRKSQSIDNFFAGCFFLTIITGALSMLSRLF